MIFKAQQQEIPQLKPLLEKKAKPKRFSQKSRWLLVVIFILTALMSLGFYLKTEWPTIYRKITSPLIISTVSQEEKFDPSPILTEIKNLIVNLRGSYGVYVYRFADDQEYGLNQTEIFPAASLMKLPVMLLVYQEAEKGNLKLDDYRELVKVMGQRSDNAAYNQLVKYFGKEKIQALIDNLGMEKTTIVKDDTAPADIGLLWRKLYQDVFISKSHQQELLGFLTDTIFEDRIPAGIPENIRVSHKIGTEMGVFSDAGIVFAPQPFVIVIMSKNAKESEAKEVIPQITKAVWVWERQGSEQ